MFGYLFLIKLSTFYHINFFTSLFLRISHLYNPIYRVAGMVEGDGIGLGGGLGFGGGVKSYLCYLYEIKKHLISHKIQTLIEKKIE